MADTETPHTEITNPLLKWVDHRLPVITLMKTTIKKKLAPFM